MMRKQNDDDDGGFVNLVIIHSAVDACQTAKSGRDDVRVWLIKSF